MNSGQETPSAPSRRGADRRRQITAAAITLIQERGYERVSVSDLAEAAELSVGGMYRHIKSKTDLLVMACEGVYGDLRERLVDAAAAEDDPADRLAAAMRLYLDACAENREPILLLYREYRSLPPDARQRFIDREGAIADVFGDLVRAGLRAGRFWACDPRVVAHDIVLLGHLPALKGWALDDRLPAAGLTDQQVELLLRTLVIPPHNRTATIPQDPT
jgi:AcrR family transcriptional regulator